MIKEEDSREDTESKFNLGKRNLSSKAKIKDKEKEIDIGIDADYGEEELPIDLEN